MRFAGCSTPSTTDDFDRSHGSAAMPRPETKPGMSGAYQPQHPVLQWIEKRLPLGRLIHAEFVAYPTPRNLNYWWTFGAILSVMLGVQIVTALSLRCTRRASIETTDLYRGIDQPLLRPDRLQTCITLLFSTWRSLPTLSTEGHTEVCDASHFPTRPSLSQIGLDATGRPGGPNRCGRFLYRCGRPIRRR
jgi:hypothetical protein